MASTRKNSLEKEINYAIFIMNQTLKLNEIGTWELKSSVVAQNRICDCAKVKLYALKRKKKISYGNKMNWIKKKRNE